MSDARPTVRSSPATLLRLTLLVALGVGATGCQEIVNGLAELAAFAVIALFSALFGLLGGVGLLVAMVGKPPGLGHLIGCWTCFIAVCGFLLMALLGLEVSNREAGIGGFICLVLATPCILWPVWASCRRVASALAGGARAIPWSVAAVLTLAWLGVLCEWAYAEGFFDGTWLSPPPPAT